MLPQSTPRRKVMLWLSCLLLGIVLLVYGLFPVLASRLSHLLAPKGVQINQIEFGYPDWRGLTVHRLDLTYHQQNSHLAIQATGLTLDYALSKLDLKALRLSLFAVQATEPVSNSSLVLPEWEQLAFLTRYPPLQLSIDQLDLSTEQPSIRLKARQLSLAHDPTANSQLNLTLDKLEHEQNAGLNEVPVALSLRLNHRDKKVEAKTTRPGQKLPWGELTYSPLSIETDSAHHNHKQLEFDFDLDQARNLLSAPIKAGLPPQLLSEDLQGEVRGSIFQSADLNPELKLQFDGQLELKGHALPSLKASQPIEISVVLQTAELTDNPAFSLKLDLKSSSNRLSLEPSQTLEISGLELSATALLQKQQNELTVTGAIINSRIDQAHFYQNDKQLKLQQIEVASRIEQIPLNQNLFYALDLPLEFKLASLSASDPRQQVQTQISGKLRVKPGLSNGLSGQLQLTNLRHWSGNSVSDESLSTEPDLQLPLIELKLSSLAPALNQGQVKLSAQLPKQLLFKTNNQALSVSADVTLAEQAFTATGQVLLDNKTSLPFSARFDRNHNSWQLSSSQQFSSLKWLNPLVKALKPQSFPEVKVLAGQLSQQSRVDSPELDSPGVISPALEVPPLETKEAQRWKAQSQINLEQINLSFGKNKVNGLTIQGQIFATANTESPVAITHSSQASLKADNLKFASDLQVSQLQASVQLASQKGEASRQEPGLHLTLTDVQMQLLQGQVESDLIEIQHNQVLPSLVSIKQLSLTELLFFMQLDQLFASGSIDAKVPIRSKNGGLVIDKAEFQATSGGVIKYDTGEALSGNIALLALKDFHYQKLDGNFSYQEQTGRYRIKIHLLGSNPAVYDGYPVDFTFNIEGELPGLFKSLFLSGSFEEGVMHSVRQKSPQ